MQIKFLSLGSIIRVRLNYNYSFLFCRHHDRSCIHHLHQIICIISCDFSRLNTVIMRTCLTPPNLPSAFSLSLPVRLRSDRLSLIKECIADCPSAYKQSTTLLNLASLLRVAGTFTRADTPHHPLIFPLCSFQVLSCI